MATDKRLNALETLFKALADGTRLRILGLLQSGEICVCDIHGSLGLPQPTVSRHLAYLRKSGLVLGRKDGLWVHYRLASLPDPVMQTVVDAVNHALGHVDAGEKDRRRLLKMADVSPVEPQPRARCC
ncbi:MAG TPA: metalloregulator ArsR/SmtB family transcription factor [Vicinamibacterales bacterium]|nr:metalloregulator ArsR/SmtB family transcription factor [Vicinamibacterales bacterium]